MSDQSSSPPVDAPDGPRTPEEAAEDAEILDRLFEDPEVVAFVKRIATHKKLSPTAAAEWCVKYCANRHASLDRYERSGRCESCKKKIGAGCACAPEVIDAVVKARETAARQAEVATMPTDAEIAERRAQRAAAKGIA